MFFKSKKPLRTLYYYGSRFSRLAQILLVKKNTHRGHTEEKFEINNLCVLCASVVNPGLVAALPRWASVVKQVGD